MAVAQLGIVQGPRVGSPQFAEKFAAARRSKAWFMSCMRNDVLTSEPTRCCKTTCSMSAFEKPETKLEPADGTVGINSRFRICRRVFLAWSHMNISAAYLREMFIPICTSESFRVYRSGDVGLYNVDCIVALYLNAPQWSRRARREECGRCVLLSLHAPLARLLTVREPKGIKQGPSPAIRTKPPHTGRPKELWRMRAPSLWRCQGRKKLII